MEWNVVLLEPAVTFLSSTEVKMRAKAFRSIELLKQFGPELPMPHSKKLKGHDLYELRVRFGSNICRLFYFFEGNDVYVVTSGYVKKTERTEQREIERALRLKGEYLGGKKQ